MIDRMITINNELHDLLNRTDEMQRFCVHVGRMECTLLKYLHAYGQPICMNDLAERLGVSHSRITRIVDTLVKKGYVERYSSPDDRRKWFARITDGGMDTVRDSLTRQKQFVEHILSMVEPEHRDLVLGALEEYIQAYKTNLDENEKVKTISKEK